MIKAKYPNSNIDESSQKCMKKLGKNSTRNVRSSNVKQSFKKRKIFKFKNSFL